jgi:hypothetical protein
VTPWLSILTPTFRRPRQLAACLASVGAQTAVAAIEHVVIVDHVGIGCGGMHACFRWYAQALHGDYIYVLGDDDVLASSTVVATLRDLVTAADFPPLVLVRTRQEEHEYPSLPAWPPREGHIGTGCAVVRADVWRQHVTDYGARYAGDYDFLAAIARARHRVVSTDLLFARGAVSRGQPEAA